MSLFMSITCACADSSHTHTHTEGFPDVLRKCRDPAWSAAPASVQAPLRHRVPAPCRPLRVPGSSATSAKGLRGRLLTGPHASAPHAVGDPHLRLENLHLCARVTGSQRYGCSVAGLHARRTFPGRHLLARHTPRPAARWDPPEACGMVTSLTGRAGVACGLPAPPGTGCMCLPVGQEGDQPRPHTGRRLQTPARAPAANGLLLRSTLALALDVSFHGAAGARAVRGRPGLHPASARSPGGERRPRGAVHRSGRQEPGRSWGRGSAAYGVTLGKLQTCSVPPLP